MTPHRSKRNRDDSDKYCIVHPPCPDIVYLKERIDEDHDRLFGNGQAGDLAEIRTSISKLDDRTDKLEKMELKWKYIFIAVIIAVNFVMGSGTASLKLLIEHLTK